ncbi:tRNA pseudouridine synthase A [bioreactor metagenome]|uniref:tRNA pseudouridine synthase A n=1 Tax=bioreactor metagenome TaxID=1076179 RepID=A0A645GJC3_9ZZZZ
MVRIIAGTLVYISEGKLSPDVSEIITAKNRAAAGITAPPYGLYLYKVYYDDVQTKN